MRWNCLVPASVLALSCTASFAQRFELPEDPALKERIRKLDMAHAEAIFKGNKAALCRSCFRMTILSTIRRIGLSRRRPSF